MDVRIGHHGVYGVDFVRCGKCSLEKMRKGVLTFGGLNVLVLEDLKVVIPPAETAKTNTVAEGISAREIANRLGVDSAFLRTRGVGFRFSGLRIVGLELAHLEGTNAVQVLSASRRADCRPASSSPRSTGSTCSKAHRRRRASITPSCPARTTATFNLSGLPAWAVGTFVGSTLTTYRDCCSISTEEGTVSLTVSATGAISGKYVMGGDASATSFSGSGFTWMDDGRLSATLSGKVDGKKKTFKLAIGENGVFFSGKISSSESIASELLVKNPWTGPNVDKSTLPTFASGMTCSFPWTGYFKGAPQAGTVSLNFSGNGKVSAKFKTKKGTVSASLQLADFSIERSEDAWSGYLVIGIPANKSKKIAGAYCYLQFSMIEGEDGLVHDVIIYDEYDPEYPLAIGFGYLNDGE